MSDPFIGEIRIFAGNFAPRNYAFCNGQILPISQNTALFSLLGTTYGGDGKTTFALPNLQDRFPMHWGQAPGLSAREIGETGGSASTLLSQSQMPLHSHELHASAAGADDAAPNPSRLLAPTAAPAYGPPIDLVPLADAMLAPMGGGAPHENRQPFLALSFIIALQGIYPARN